MVDENTAQIRRLEVRMAEAAKDSGSPQYVLEKDNALSYLIKAIAEVPDLLNSLMFKGGTCLRKTYFSGYRFSEDLDFTSTIPWTCDDLFTALQESVGRMEYDLSKFGPFTVTVTEEGHRDPVKLSVVLGVKTETARLISKRAQQVTNIPAEVKRGYIKVRYMP